MSAVARMNTGSVAYSMHAKAQNVAAGSKYADSTFGHICRKLAVRAKVRPLLNKSVVITTTKTLFLISKATGF